MSLPGYFSGRALTKELLQGWGWFLDCWGPNSSEVLFLTACSQDVNVVL